MNIPVIGLLPNYEFFIRENAINDFKKLEESNIIFTNNKKAADFINKNYNNYENFWFSVKTQNSVREFSEIYSKYCDDPAEFYLDKIKSLKV